ncbi:DUF1489 domain-containing protein [Bombella sp. TMW 2.2559]|uniref:DUF1489 domain-containing protein n=1 Tax=Bombella dulcis TaxID=2967339 RepID=A0ABT3WAZ3_9PROT|nr:DUF1489 domain-containing protein [Bombella dulcis]MCX5616257.1 DUF1489 domain-containing protein [Bombella dulcis]
MPAPKTPTLHMIKLIVGCTSPEMLRDWVAVERHGDVAYVRTRTMPKRADEILEGGGSIYRVINGLIMCRQPIIGFDSYTREDGHPGTLILVSDDVIPTQPRPMRPFQGWRYFKPEDTPPDLDQPATGVPDNGISSLPASLRNQLSELGLL